MAPLTLTTVSKHLTEEVINEVFKFKTKSEDHVKYIEVTPAAPAGQGLMSAVYRIKAIGDKHDAYFIVKGLVQDDLLRKSIFSTELFEREALFFSNILPALIETQASLEAKERIKSILPICYGYHVDGEADYILMEDLSEKDFRSILETPTKSERDMTLKGLAHFHSVSFALRLQQPDVFTNLTEDLKELYFTDRKRDWYANYLQSALNIDKDVLLEIEGTGSLYYKKFCELTQKDIYGLLIILATTKGDHPVINHGDAWWPNFLFCKEEAVIIDFQFLRCASPAVDLSYCIILSSNHCRNKEDFYEAVCVYYTALEYYLTDMGFDANKVFSLKTLHEELKKYGQFGLLAALTSIPLLASSRCDNLQSFEEKYSYIDKIPLEELWKLSPIKSNKDKQQLVNAIRVAVDVGLI